MKNVKVKVSYEDLVKAFNKVSSEDENSKNLFISMPLLVPTFTIILTKIFDELVEN